MLHADQLTPLPFSSLRIRFLVGHIIHLPTLKHDMARLYASSPVDTQHVDMDQLALMFALFTLALAFPPRYCPPRWASMESLATPEMVRLFYSASLACLRHKTGDELVLRSRDAIRTAVLLAFYEPEAVRRDARLATSISSAMHLGLHRRNLAAEEIGNSADQLQCEMDRRLWWVLVARDWTGSIGRQGYMIRPSQFDVPLPGN